MTIDGDIQYPIMELSPEDASALGCPVALSAGSTFRKAPAVRSAISRALS
jgi:hypothetical protein